MVIKQITKYPIYHCHFKTRKCLALTFVRMQEWYESPKFRHKIFTLGEFKEWYSKNHDGKFSYITDWSGFNIPSDAVNEVYRWFPDLSREETRFFKKLDKLGLLHSDERYYLIGTFGDKNARALNHEIRHGMFFCNTEYRKQILAVLKKHDCTSIRNSLIKMEYCKEVLNDEIQAYVLTDPAKTKSGKKLQKELKKVESTFI